MQPFSTAHWIWSREQLPNAYVLFAKDLALPGERVRVRISASYHYELYINGDFVARGPVHGDPAWCQYDEWTYEGEGDSLHVAILAHHSAADLHYLLPAPPGLIAEFESGGESRGTDESWHYVNLGMWRQDVPKRGWALDYCEDYDAALEPAGWPEMVFPDHESWAGVQIVPDAQNIWGGYQKRMVPKLERRFIHPARFKAFYAPGEGADDVGDISVYSDDEELIPVADWQEWAGKLPERANAFTFDLGRERIGFYAVEVEAPAGTMIEISGAELLREGRPWIFRKGTRYSARFQTREGRQTLKTFGWSGFRYLHVVVRGDMEDVRILRAGCLERRPPLTYSGTFRTDDENLRAIFDLCRYTLEVGAQEHLIDCPTREQTQYWGDAVFIAESLWAGFDAPHYLKWYLEGFLHVPFKENGQISATYPGEHIALLDYSLIPLVGQRFHKAHTGSYYKPAETVRKALHLKKWYDENLNAAGLVAFDYEAYAEQGLRNFIDHPGVGWHNFPHPGIDRDGVSCPLNIFFYAFVRTLSEMAEAAGHESAESLGKQADDLAAAIRRTFYDGRVFYDAAPLTGEGPLSEGTAWQTNALAVYFGLIEGDKAAKAMRTMLEGYDMLCRCSPYFHFYFLPALRMAGLEPEAIELIKQEWGLMLARDATTTWEGFLGDEKDSLCHPWSTAPFLFLLDH